MVCSPRHSVNALVRSPTHANNIKLPLFNIAMKSTSNNKVCLNIVTYTQNNIKEYDISNILMGLRFLFDKFYGCN